MKVWFTSDQHFWHANVIRYCNRPFASVEEMNEMLILNWNSVVGPEDIVYLLGDFSMALRPVEVYPKRLIAKEIHLIHGNHDWNHPYHKKSRKPENQKQLIEKYIQCGFASVATQKVISLDGKDVLLHHMPYAGNKTIDDHYDDKYEKYRPLDAGLTLLCGHVHEKWKIGRSPKNTLMINVGVDVWDLTPVSADQIVNTIRQAGA